MPQNLPSSHLIANEQLEGEAYYDLFEIHMTDSSVVYLHANSQVTWQGNTYEAWALQLSEVSDNAGEEKSRPTLNLMNIDGAFNFFIRSGYLHKARIHRKRVLKQHILANANVFQERVWLTWNPSQLNNNFIGLELRSFIDGQGFTLPVRRYMPPEFPYVSLG